MAHPFRIKEIAVQAGLSEATVDRVLNERGMVRADTAAQVKQAIADLERQRSQLQLGGRTFMVDVVVQAPERFSGAVRTALEEELPSLRPAVIRSRFHLRETGGAADLVAVLDRIAARGSHGVILKAPDVPEVDAAAAGLARAGIPVFVHSGHGPAAGDLNATGRRSNQASLAFVAILSLGPKIASL